MISGLAIFANGYLIHADRMIGGAGLAAGAGGVGAVAWTKVSSASLCSPSRLGCQERIGRPCKGSSKNRSKSRKRGNEPDPELSGGVALIGHQSKRWRFPGSGLPRAFATVPADIRVDAVNHLPPPPVPDDSPDLDQFGHGHGNTLKGYADIRRKLFPRGKNLAGIHAHIGGGYIPDLYGVLWSRCFSNGFSDIPELFW